MVWNETRKTSEPTVSSYAQGFELKWDKKEVKELLDSSSVPCTNFYVGPAALDSSSEPITDRHYQIQNMTDFLEGSFEDLMDMGTLGISYKEESLYLIPAARKKERENREASLGMREPRLYT